MFKRMIQVFVLFGFCTGTMGQHSIKTHLKTLFDNTPHLPTDLQRKIVNNLHSKPPIEIEQDGDSVSATKIDESYGFQRENLPLMISALNNGQKSKIVLETALRAETLYRKIKEFQSNNNVDGIDFKSVENKIALEIATLRISLIHFFCIFEFNINNGAIIVYEKNKYIAEKSDPLTAHESFLTNFFKNPNDQFQKILKLEKEFEDLKNFAESHEGRYIILKAQYEQALRSKQNVDSELKTTADTLKASIEEHETLEEKYHEMRRHAQDLSDQKAALVSDNKTLKDTNRKLKFCLALACFWIAYEHAGSTITFMKEILSPPAIEQNLQEAPKEQE